MDAFAWSIARSVYPVLASVAVIGVVLNTILLLTTIFTKKLRSTANILIGCCALFDIMHECGYFIQFPILFSDYYIDSYYCSLMQFIPALGRAAGAVCVFCIGVDRMICLLTVTFYKNMKRMQFLICHFIAIALFCAFTTYLMIAFWTPKQQICSMPAPFHGDSLGIWSNTITGINLLSALIYFITWQVVKRRGASTHQKRIFHSIAVVMVVEVTGWLISSILIDLSKVYVVPERRPPFHYVACLFVNTGVAVKAIVYYSIASDYRKAIRAFLCMPENAVRSADARQSRGSDEQETSSRQVAGQEKRGDPTVPNNTV
ncbi:srsx-38 [Pristionchus pacificus]|uniref:Srsx-38 n=1 Tax=Pristionchus pacificus TaxID=54126 RepID=A0A454XYA4_PRIPA|nr:srsx-38 [Pristionchus pacificus]|eukprot:PDM65386.1 srsx-38 [Pristionchus pacificus]